jgi:nucleoside-diphosphate-sugar epimerase
MRIVVTGATGFLASHLVPALAAEGHDVFALGHDEARIPSGERVTPVVVDLAQPLASSALPDADAVIHLAQANVPLPEGARELFGVNTYSTHELLDWGRRSGVACFVFASSGSVYGLGEGAVDEDTPRRASDLYAVTKRAAELLVEAYAGEYRSTSILRPFAPYGPGQKGRLIPSLIRRVRAGEPVTLTEGGRPRMTPMFVADTVRAFAAALELDGHHAVNVAGDEVVSIADLATAIADALGVEPVFDERLGSAGDLIADNARMHELLGLGTLVPLAEGIPATALAAAPA